MKLFVGSSIIFLASSSPAIVITVMRPASYSPSLGAGFGHAGLLGATSFYVPPPNPGDLVVSLNSITIHGWKSGGPGQTDVYLSGGAFQYLHVGGGGIGRVDGDITFKPAPVQSTLAQRIISVGSGTIPTSTFTPSGKAPNPLIDFAAHAGTPAGWNLIFTNGSLQFGGTFTGISIDVDLLAAPVPEPSSIALLGVGIGALIRRQRRR